MEDQAEVVPMSPRGATEDVVANSDVEENSVTTPFKASLEPAAVEEDVRDGANSGWNTCGKDFCFSNNCVMSNSVITCFAMVISVGVLVGLTVTMARPHLAALVYVNGTCTTLSSNYTGMRERCQCGGRFCVADYPCLEIKVEYPGKNGRMIESMLHEEEHVFTYRSHCTYQPETCAKGNNDFMIDLYKHRWGVPGKSFPCFHNPSGEGALRKRTRSVSFILLIILIPAVFSIISTVLCCVVYCYCCPRSRVHKFNSEKH